MPPWLLLYSRKRLRLGGFDYSAEGLYLITARTHGGACTLGTIPDETFVASALGLVVEEQIRAVPQRLDGVEMDASVVMPNHFHVIVALERARQASPLRLGDIVGALKSGSAREINMRRATPGAKVWQRGYHDHIIRDEVDLRRVREYIESNPIRWALDPENPEKRS